MNNKENFNADFSFINNGCVHTGLPWGAIFDRLGWPEYFGLRIEKGKDNIITIYEKDLETETEKKQTIPEQYRLFCEENFNLDNIDESTWGYKNPENAGTALFPDLTAWYMLGYENNCMYVFWLKKDGATRLHFVLHDNGHVIKEGVFDENELKSAKEKGIHIVNETSYTICWGSVHEDTMSEKWIEIDSPKNL